MSETSSDAESSCGWTLINNEGSDIETLGSEAVVEYGTELMERPPVEKSELQGTHVSALAGCVEERGGDSRDDDTLVDHTIVETLYPSEDRDNAAGTEHVTLLSSSDLSDIMTLRDLKEDEYTDEEDEAPASEEFYLGTSCSSQYAFTAAETVFPVQAATNTSSSEDETGRRPSTVPRRRRVRKNTTSTVTLESAPHEEVEKEEVKEQKQQEPKVQPSHDVHVQDRCRSILNTCVVLTLVIGACMSFGHFYGADQLAKLPDNDEGSDPFPHHVQKEPFPNQHEHQHQKVTAEPQARWETHLVKKGADPELISALKEIFEKIKKENQESKFGESNFKAHRDDLDAMLKKKAKERTDMMAEKQRLVAENQQLKNSLEREEKSQSTLQEELRNLHAQITDLEMEGAGADSLRSENQRLKEELEDEKQLIRTIHIQREELMAEAQTLKKKLEKERKVTEELRRELNYLRSDIHEKEVGSGAEELQSRLTELEKRLTFEQQRSDLWEKLYLETKEERAKGDTESKMKKPKKGMAGKVQETFDAVKNSTKEFVHHHKEQIKKAKEAVKENLRKFSDSVKSTFRHIKDSASTFINKARGFCHEKCDERDPKVKERWQHRSHKPHHRHSHRYDDSFQSSRNTRKSGHKVHEDQGQHGHKASAKGCAGVFDCAYQESMSLFNRAMEPIRADEFYQLLQSYVQREVDHFHHWNELETFVNDFFRNGVFIHDQMLFTDFVSGVEDYLARMHEYQGLHDNTFGDLDDYVYRHFFGEAYTKRYSPRGPFEKPVTCSKEDLCSKHHHRRQQRARSRPHTERKWSRSGRDSDRHMADVKIELGPLPFDPKY